MKEKLKIKTKLYKLLKEAENLGVEIYVASDPEGNNYHSIKPANTFYPHKGNFSEKENAIVLGVWEQKEEEQLFSY